MTHLSFNMTYSVQKRPSFVRPVSSKQESTMIEDLGVSGIVYDSLI